jgi:UDP-N-acetylglucosamine 2-epimerase
VGLRQRGRQAGVNVIFCDPDRESIRQAIAKAMDPGFRSLIFGMVNPYGDGRSCERAYEFIVNTDFPKVAQKAEDPLTR